MEEQTLISAAEAAEYGEFKRNKREAEIAFTLRRLIIDASRLEEPASLKRACETAQRLNASAVLVSPVNVIKARKQFTTADVPIYCNVGGTGESVIAVKKKEAKIAVRQGVREIKITLCYSALKNGNAGYLKRELKRIRRAVKKRTLTVSLENYALSEEEISLGVKAACAAGADGVCVRGEARLVECAVTAGAGRVFVEVAGVENSAQLKALIKAGAARAVTADGGKIAEELYAALPERNGEI